MSNQTANPVKDILIYATDTMADWEFAYLTTEVAGAEQARPGRFRVRFVGDGQSPVRTLGGLPITPDLDLSDVALDGAAVLVLPGGDTYAEGHDRALATVDQFRAAGLPVAAICGATLALARHGVLDAVPHTSNAPSFLESTGYAGAEHYRIAPAVNADGIITATGLRPTEFTAEVLLAAGVFPTAYVEAWRRLQAEASEDAFGAYLAQAEAFAA